MTDEERSTENREIVVDKNRSLTIFAMAATEAMVAALAELEKVNEQAYLQLRRHMQKGDIELGCTITLHPNPVAEFWGQTDTRRTFCRFVLRPDGHTDLTVTLQ